MASGVGIGIGIGEGLKSLGESLSRKWMLEHLEREKQADKYEEQARTISGNLMQKLGGRSLTQALAEPGDDHAEIASMYNELAQTVKAHNSLYPPHETPALVARIQKFVGKQPSAPRPDERASLTPQRVMAQTPARQNELMQEWRDLTDVGVQSGLDRNAAQAEGWKALMVKYGLTPKATTATPRTVTTEQGVFVLNQDGTIGNRLGDRPQPNAPRQQTVNTKEGVFTVNPDGSLGNKLGDLPNSTAPRTVTTERGVFILNPDGSLGNRLGDRPRSSLPPVVIQTGEGPQLVNRGTGTASPITSGGQQVPPAPTSEMRNKEEARKLVGTGIDAIKAIGDTIITKIGPSQRADAIARGAEAVFGTDPNFRTYQDARMALAGNLAVAQQGSRPSDADIKAIWLPLIPDPYRDTKESAAQKWQLINTMIGLGGQKPVDFKGQLNPNAGDQMIDVQIPGQPPGKILSSQWEAFKQKYPNAVKVDATKPVR